MDPKELENGNDNPEKNDSTDEDKSGENKNKEEKKEEKQDDFQRKIQTEEPKKKETSDVVPLKKYLDKKLKIKDLEREIADLKNKHQSGNNSFNSKDLDDLAEEFGANPEALKKLAAVLTPKQNADLEAKVAKLEETNKLLLAKDQRRDQEKLFDKHFKEKIVKNYPELKDKKSLFKQVWFSPTFPDLKTLDDIRKEFFPHIKEVEKQGGVKKESLEPGSGGTTKGAKVIDFAKMTDEQHIEVLKDPELKAKYYEWLDSKG